MLDKPFIFSYPNCASIMDWANCSNNCIGSKDNPCINHVSGDDPCGVIQSGLNCFPKSCEKVCSKKQTNSKLKDLHIGIL